MTDAQRLALIRGVHALICIVMVAAIGVLLCAGVTGSSGRARWLGSMG